jgi:hypothetical protein
MPLSKRETTFVPDDRHPCFMVSRPLSPPDAVKIERTDPS